jgi:hypothetical protein
MNRLGNNAGLGPALRSPVLVAGITFPSVGSVTLAAVVN